MNRSPRIIWFAIAFSTVIYMILAYMLTPAPVGTFEEAFEDMRVLVLYAAAFAAFVAGLVLPSVLKTSPQQKMLITLNVFEMCAVCGLIAAYLQQDWRVYIPAWILSLAGIIRAFPKDQQVPA